MVKRHQTMICPHCDRTFEGERRSDCPGCGRNWFSGEYSKKKQVLVDDELYLWLLDHTAAFGNRHRVGPEFDEMWDRAEDIAKMNRLRRDP